MKVEILRAAGGEPEEHDVDPATVMEFIRTAIGAETLDTVLLPEGKVMLVNDRGYEFRVEQAGPGHVRHVPVRALLPDNAEATRRYHEVCKPGTTHRIVGDVAIVLDSEVQ